MGTKVRWWRGTFSCSCSVAKGCFSSCSSRRATRRVAPPVPATARPGSSSCNDVFLANCRLHRRSLCCSFAVPLPPGTMVLLSLTRGVQDLGGSLRIACPLFAPSRLQVAAVAELKTAAVATQRVILKARTTIGKLRSWSEDNNMKHE